MYIKTFMEDCEHRGDFFPVAISIYNQINDYDNVFGDFRVTYSVDGSDKEKPFYPLFASAVYDRLERRSLIWEEGHRAPDEIRISVVDGFCFGYYFSPSGTIEEQISFDSLVEAVDAEEFLTIRVEILGQLLGENAEKYEREILETYTITAGFDAEEDSFALHIDIETQTEKEELFIA